MTLSAAAVLSIKNYALMDHLGQAMWKCVSRHVWTAKAQISLDIGTVWSGPSLSAYIFIILAPTHINLL